MRFILIASAVAAVLGLAVYLAVGRSDLVVDELKPARAAVLTGRAPPASSLAVWLDGRELPGVSTAGPDGRFSTTVRLPYGKSSLKVMATVAGRDRPAEAVLSASLEPPAPTEVAGQADSGKMKISGRVEPGCQVEARLGGRSHRLAVVELPDSTANRFEGEVELARAGETVAVVAVAGELESRPVAVKAATLLSAPRIASTQIFDEDSKVRVIGEGPPGSLVTLSAPGGQTLSTPAAQGRFWAVLDLAGGDNPFTLSASHGGLKSSSLSFVVTAPPRPPFVLQVTTSKDRKFLSTVSARVLVPSSEVYMKRAGTADARRLVPAGGVIFENSVLEPLTPGANRWLIWAVYKGLKSSEVSFVATGAAPVLAAPTLSGQIPAVVHRESLEVKGTLARGLHARVVLNGVASLVKPGQDGTFAATLKLREGPNSLWVTAVSPVGDGQSAAVERSIARIARLDGPTLGTLPATVSGEALLLEGKTSAGVKVFTLLDGAPLPTATADATGAFRIALRLKEGPNTIRVWCQLDEARSVPIERIVKLPGVPVPTVTNPPATVERDQLDRLSGKAPQGSVVHLSVGSAGPRSCPTDGRGRFSFAGISLSMGENRIKLQATIDERRSPVVTIAVVRVVPKLAPPTFTPAVPTRVADPRLTLRGRADPDSRVMIQVGESPPASLTPTGGRFEHSVALPGTGATLTAWTVRGDQQSRKVSTAVVIDTKPAAPTLDEPLPEEVSSPDLTVRGAAAGTVFVKVGGRQPAACPVRRGRFSGRVRLQRGTNVLTYWAAVGTLESDRQEARVLLTPPEAPTPAEQPPPTSTARVEPAPEAPPPPEPVRRGQRPRPPPDTAPGARPADHEAGSRAGPSCPPESHTLTVSRDLGNSVSLPSCSRVRIVASGDADFAILVSPGSGLESYVAWCNDGSTRVPTVARRGCARSHSFVFQRPGSGQYIIILDAKCYPDGGQELYADPSVRLEITPE